MPLRARALVLAAFGGPWVVACAHTDAPTADPEAAQLDPPVVVVDEPEPEPEPEPEQTAEAPTAVPADPNAEVIQFTGADAEPEMADQVTGDPKRDPLPSMMSDIIKGPNK